MADQKSVLLKIELDVSGIKDNAKQAVSDIDRIKEAQAVLKSTTGTNTIEYAKLSQELRSAQKVLKDNASALAINEQLQGKSNLTTFESAQLQKALSVAYNNLTKEERENTEAGRALTKQYGDLNESLRQQGLSVNDGRRSVGLYEKSIIAAQKTIASLKEEQTKLGYAQTQNSKKLEEAKKGLDKLGDQADTTTAQYQDLSAEVNFYNNAIKINEKSISEINSELIQQEEQLKVTAKEAAAIGFVYGNNENAAQSLKSQLKELKAELSGLDVNSEEFAEGTKRAGELADKIKDVNEAVAAKATGSKFEQLSNQAGLLAGDLKNLDFEGVAEKAAMFQKTASSISLKELSQGAKQAGSALVSLGKTLITSPVFLLLGAVGIIVAFWDDISEAINGTDLAQEALNETTEDYRKGAADAGKKTLEVANAFKLAKNGTISQDEALKIYNDTLGDAFGKQTNLNDAEKTFTAKTAAYVEAAGLRAQANALIAKSADEQAKALTAQFDNNVGLLDAVGAAFSNPFASGEDLAKEAARLQSEGTKSVQSESKKRAKIYSDEATRLLELAEEKENSNGILSDSEKALNDDLARLAKERSDRAKAAAAERLRIEKEVIDRIRELTLGNAELSASQLEREVQATTAFRKRIAELEIKDAVQLAERLLQIEKDNAEALKIVDQDAKAARIATIESNLQEEIKTLEGSAEKRIEQEKLLRDRANIEIAALNTEYDNRELDRTAQVESAKTALKTQTLKTEQEIAADRITAMEANLIHEETLLKEAGFKEEDIAKRTAAKRIEIAIAQNKAIQENESVSDADKLKSAAELEAKLLEIKQDSADQQKTIQQELSDFLNNKVSQDSIAAAQQLAAELSQITQDKIQQELNQVAASYSDQNDLLQDKLDNGIISQDKYNSEQKKLQEKQQAEEAKLKREAFKKQKAADIVQATIQTSLSVLQALASAPPPVSFILAGIAAALGAVQIARIATQPEPAFAGGGKVLSGKKITNRDGKPIYRKNGDNLQASVKIGEAILNTTQQENIAAMTGLSVSDTFAAAGVPGFAAGGLVGGSSIAATQLAGTASSQAQQAILADTIANMPRPVVYVEDIRSGTDRAVSVEQSADIF